MKRAALLCCMLFLLLGIAGCSKEVTSAKPQVTETITSEASKDKSEENLEVKNIPQNASEEKKQEQDNKENSQEEIEKSTKETEENIGNQDEKQHILEDLAVKNVDVPALQLTGNRWSNYKEEDLQNLWKYYYPYMEVVFGPIADDFWEQGLTWNMSDETMKLNCCEQHPEENRIDMGTPGVDTDFRQCAHSLVHETGHLWLQNKNEGINFDCGQWLWEANSLLFERIAEMEMLDPEHRPHRVHPTGFDLINYAGPDAVNGVYSDGLKANRSISDQAGTDALYLLDTALSTPGTYDYWRNVSIERTKYCKDNNVSLTPPDVLGEIMDRVADGKTMDGMKPSEWLFSRSVANTAGADGNILSVFGFYNNLPDDSIPDSQWPSGVGNRIDAVVNCYSRKDGKEKCLTGTEVEVTAYNYKGIKKGSGKVNISENCETQVRIYDDIASEKTELIKDYFEDYSVIRYVATATIDGKEYSDTNYQIVTGPDDYVGEDDNRLFFILLNEDETIDLNELLIDVQGGIKVDKSHVLHGLIIVHANQGDNVTIAGQTYTKPRGARVIPIFPHRDEEQNDM